jgi:UDP-N-acetylglucosamine 2-epimerase (non-hydrolysing)
MLSGCFIILGDTNSLFSYFCQEDLRFHIYMEAGNAARENLPEETNRRIVDHIADVNLCYSEHAGGI